MATDSQKTSSDKFNFVFDMGGVLMKFDTRLFSNLYVDSPDDTRLIEAALYKSPSWPLLDAGVISEHTMEALARTKVPERLWKPMHKGFLEWEQHQPVLQHMNDVVVALHDAGCGCYLLSNAGVRWWRQKDRIPSMKVMDGFVVSAFEHMMKPDPLIYTTLCKRYQLDPVSCIFVDDNADNCAGAEAAGMKSYHYDGDADTFVSWAESTYNVNLKI
ncbi:HAD family phosphatase [Atopobium sp. oral taxon 416]|jgi:putative hydrolase of the HAD superfamily|uniref:HAD family hydrolase n=1 Tax=Atopobium sp. oral taxon 416 TaxID=712157 RepID=UPI001BAD9877|nr:HAD family phosphatase [Atopobium sp. oral taxon 416]QUC02087.1 HAD family phosphatase [Atopobium sp. oral taxon 416]